jgi:uncharacterized phage protein gp47/JayE
MLNRAPDIDPRSAAEVAEETRQFLAAYLAGKYGWKPGDDGGEAGRALTQVFAHFCRLVIDRLNRAPDKHYLAFLDLLGNSPVPAQPARAALTFFVDRAALQPSTLPAGTRVLAQPAGAGEAIVFETDRDLALTTVALVSVQRGTATLTPLIEKANGAEAVFASTDPYVFGFSVRTTGQPIMPQTVELYFLLDAPEYTPASPSFAAAPPALLWERAPGAQGPWQRLLVEDETDSLTRSGTVRFRTPPDSGWDAAAANATERRLWVRAKAPATAYTPAPVLRGVALNTVPATQGDTLREEVLGSSDGNAGQTFVTSRKPVMPGQALQVRERRDWIAWTEAPDFHASTGLDRHYLLDRQSGLVRFGDGIRGMIPPAGARNVRMAAYRIGGGARGNVAAGAISVLASGSKAVAKVSNLLPAAGGADVESVASVLERAPRTLRHRYRAVTQDDYEDVARLASAEVARALCVPLQDLAAEPYKVVVNAAEAAAGAGKVSVVIVPQSSAPRPLPSAALLRTVAAYVAERASGDAAISVVGPLYLRVSVSVTVKLRSVLLADRVERQLQEAFAAFLHPLTGGAGAGWPFGRLPYKSDFYQLVAAVDGVTFISALTIAREADAPSPTDAVEKTGRFLVYSGTHTVTFDQS